MQHKIKSKEEAKELLNKFSERCVQNMSKLIDIHLKIDPPRNKLTDAHGDEFYRMRKVLFHASMIRDMGNYNEYLHAIAVESRVAQEQMENVLQGEIKQHSRGMLPPKYLDAFVHPTPITLANEQYHGGLCNEYPILLHGGRIMTLLDFGFSYTITLLLLANVHNHQSSIECIFEDFIEVGNSMPSPQELVNLFYKKNQTNIK